MLHVWEFRDDKISRDNIWLDSGAIINQLPAHVALEQGRVDASIFSPQQQIVLASKGYPVLTDVGRLLPEVPALGVPS